MPPDTDYATIFERALLPLCEHVLWNAKESPRGTRNFVMDLFRPLAKEDHVRSRYEALKSRFDAPKFVQPSFEVLAEAMG